MKKALLVLIFFSSLLIFKAQNSVDKGRLQFKVGNSVFFGKTFSSNYFEESSSNMNGGAQNFSSFLTQFSAHYNTHKNFALGLYLQSGIGNKDSVSYSNNSLGFLAEYYLINKPKFNLFIDISAGNLSFNSTNNSSTSDSISYNYSGKGSSNSIGIGVNKYFGNVFGFTLRTGYMRNGLRLNNFSINGNSEEFINNNQVKDLKVLFDGGYLNFGIVIKLRNKSPKSE